ncbi:lipopolysaccharide biosynthesis protein RfbH [Aliarcobacter butzleri]|uniref:Lipopolysaccharide biosynthesis protein RfbH n=2 Tax=Aliarcobacter butzleri TaxID=28197 RepID=A0AAP4UYA1_9BACT|nr:lipopolysaccharide biosynthesis protein RfbH [Aliarcobacter butzleri]MCT7556234.1 lipopolysaccharide biosynthesis protein RfbH [Aliarcobacter butzleri]MCT7593289.1 lipopolysaccharide biosynthesis protein RfbH [Aliarcobacter butzleri]MCT7597949.1 lipopolysaccharide biosynthesis protein RfbH [Aliarcobacter butzleri]MDN5051956.1 lipopolysaccharide biosynthesis protein RfbH [Aliarcobacter butzleri]MDN5074651.1 lipopolysaccharide biosynthesis protein RfbH [Aliarcobacter butzleri]
MTQQEKLKQEILQKTKEYYELVHKPNQTKKFVDGETRVNYAGRVFDEIEMQYLVDSSLDFWLTYGDYSKRFEKTLAKYLGVRYAFLVNSGSSANLLAFYALTSPLLKERQVKRCDEVITVAAGFPTTVAPIVQYGAVPVFVDMDLTTANIDVTQLELALSSKTKAVMIAHTLGNPFNLKVVKEFCDKHNLWLIEDNCDALGSTYEGKFTGTWGDIGTSSFYPPHHMTMGEGGATYTNNPLLKKIMLSLRDWGRDCWCESGVDNTCGCRFSQSFGTLPKGYDHKYVYSHFGFNLKATDMQAAIGVAQLEKFPTFVEKRKENQKKLYDGLKDLEQLHLVETQPNSDPSWFGFMMTLKDGVNFTRNELVEYLEANKIQTRNLFAGNMTRHPMFDSMVLGKDYRVIGDLKVTDKIMNDSFWIGLYPGMGDDSINYMIKKIREFILNKFR